MANAKIFVVLLGFLYMCTLIQSAPSGLEAVSKPAGGNATKKNDDPEDLTGLEYRRRREIPLPEQSQDDDQGQGEESDDDPEAETSDRKRREAEEQAPERSELPKNPAASSSHAEGSQPQRPQVSPPKAQHSAVIQRREAETTAKTPAHKPAREATTSKNAFRREATSTSAPKSAIHKREAETTAKAPAHKPAREATTAKTAFRREATSTSAPKSVIHKREAETTAKAPAHKPAREATTAKTAFRREATSTSAPKSVIHKREAETTAKAPAHKPAREATTAKTAFRREATSTSAPKSVIHKREAETTAKAPAHKPAREATTAKSPHNKREASETTKAPAHKPSFNRREVTTEGTKAPHHKREAAEESTKAPVHKPSFNRRDATTGEAPARREATTEATKVPTSHVSRREAEHDVATGAVQPGASIESKPVLTRVPAASLQKNSTKHSDPASSEEDDSVPVPPHQNSGSLENIPATAVVSSNPPHIESSPIRPKRALDVNTKDKPHREVDVVVVPVFIRQMPPLIIREDFREDVTSRSTSDASDSDESASESKETTTKDSYLQFADDSVNPKYKEYIKSKFEKEEDVFSRFRRESEPKSATEKEESRAKTEDKNDKDDSGEIKPQASTTEHHGLIDAFVNFFKPGHHAENSTETTVKPTAETSPVKADVAGHELPKSQPAPAEGVPAGERKPVPAHAPESSHAPSGEKNTAPHFSRPVRSPQLPGATSTNSGSGSPAKTQEQTRPNSSALKPQQAAASRPLRESGSQSNGSESPKVPAQKQPASSNSEKPAHPGSSRPVRSPQLSGATNTNSGSGSPAKTQEQSRPIPAANKPSQAAAGRPLRESGSQSSGSEYPKVPAQKQPASSNSEKLAHPGSSRPVRSPQLPGATITNSGSGSPAKTQEQSRPAASSNKPSQTAAASRPLRESGSESGKSETPKPSQRLSLTKVEGSRPAVASRPARQVSGGATERPSVPVTSRPARVPQASGSQGISSNTKPQSSQSAGFTPAARRPVRSPQNNQNSGIQIPDEEGTSGPSSSFFQPQVDPPRQPGSGETHLHQLTRSL